MNVLSLFDGISCGHLALERAGIQVDKYYASEIEPNAIKITQKNWVDTIQLGDVTNWRKWNIKPSSKSKRKYRCAVAWVVMPSVPSASLCGSCAAPRARSASICAARHPGGARTFAPARRVWQRRARQNGWSAPLRCRSPMPSMSA